TCAPWSRSNSRTRPTRTTIRSNSSCSRRSCRTARSSACSTATTSGCARSSRRSTSSSSRTGATPARNTNCPTNSARTAPPQRQQVADVALDLLAHLRVAEGIVQVAVLAEHVERVDVLVRRATERIDVARERVHIYLAGICGIEVVDLRAELPSLITELVERV